MALIIQPAGKVAAGGVELGDLSRIPCCDSANSQVYEKTGNTRDGRPVYCKSGDLRRAHSLLDGDEYLYVLRADGQIVPLLEYLP